MNTLSTKVVLSGLLLMASSAVATAQQPAAAPAQSAPPAVGDMAPDFEIRGATRYGLLEDAGRLSDLRDQTVVLAFFARARTRG